MIKKRTTGIFMIIEAIVCLALKIACFAAWEKIEHPYDQPLILLCFSYYISLSVLCFFCGKTNTSSVIVASVLGFEILMQLVAVLCKSPAIFGTLYYIIAASGYALNEWIHSFENVGQTISNWWYFTAFVVGQLVFMGIILMGRKIWVKGKN